MSEISTIAATVSTLAAPGMKPKQLIAAVRERHPEATKKQVVRAAFYALTEGGDTDPEAARRLHDFALTERAAPTEATPAPRKPRKRKPAAA